MNKYLFTSESVSAGHPDKVCDQISDMVVDMYLEQDPFSRLAVETLATTNRVILSGEFRSSAKINNDEIQSNVKDLIKEIGYDQDGFSYNKIIFENYLHTQSADIAQGVDETNSHEEGAGDQGIMFGYATKETDTFMPAPIYYANKILQNLHQLRIEDELGKKILNPDAKSQVTFVYENNQPIGIDNILVSTQHNQDAHSDDIKQLVYKAIELSVKKDWMPDNSKILINPTGRFVIGGPDGDTGLTGRKIIVDTYGGAAPHGGGAFSGKDPTKVDRSAAYMMRYLAKNIVAADLCDKCVLQVAYSIGVSKPLSLYINTHNTNKVSEDSILNWLNKNIDLRPKGIRTHLNLNRAIYLRTAAYGHFGRSSQEDGGFSWEKLDLVNDLKNIK